MAGAAALVAEAAKHVGKIHEPSGGNIIHKWYNANVENLGAYNWSWCDAFVSYCASKSGNMKAVCPKGGRAYTVYHARDFQKLGQWHSGTRANVAKAKPGDIVFFDWGGSDSINNIDHVGIVVRAHSNGTVDTIEGNTSNACLRRTRSYTDIAGYGRPKYATNDEEFDDVAVEDVWKKDGILASPPWIAEKGNKSWTAESYLVWLYRNQAKQTDLLNELKAKLAAQDATVSELVKTVSALAANSADLDADALVANIKDAIAAIEIKLDVAGEDEAA